MTLRIYNTLSKEKESFTPLTAGTVLFYVCGVTVYDHCHIGHARAAVAFDVMRRYLAYLGYAVTYIQNFTDIDDKIINRSNEMGIPFSDLTAQMMASFFEDMDALGIQRATNYPKATDHIGDMIALIETLIKKGVAYESGGDVLFAVDAFPEYGKLSKKVLDDLEAGSRVEVDQNKKNPFDFVLWKAAKTGEPSWESPWGNGRPGWHIECSAMAIKALGETIDIHGGGSDLIFPHHENEIAQSECATGKPFARYWVHNGFVKVNNQKMSKSLGNFFRIKDVLDQFNGQIVRFFLVKSQYRSAIDFSDAALKEAESALKRLQTTVQDCPPDVNDRPEELLPFVERFHAAMCDDFNTAEAVGILFELAKWINIHKKGSIVLVELAQLLGLELVQEDDLAHAVQVLIEKRTQARQNKDFAAADALRDQLLNEFGVIIKDTPDGIKWTYKSS